MATGKSAARRQGAVAFDSSASEVAPVMVGGLYMSSPSQVDNNDVAWFPTDSYGRLQTVQMAYDDAMEGALLASASRTSTSNSGDLTNYNARGATVWLDATVISGSETLTLYVQSKDTTSGSYLDLLVSASISTIGNYYYIVYPGVGTAAEDVTEVVGFPLPRTWRVNVVHDSGSPFTYSVGHSYTL